MRYLLIPVGSAGDVHPLIALALRLRSRGHQVSVLTSPYFQPLCDHHGLRLIPVGTAEEFLAGIRDPELWQPQRAIQVVGRYVEQSLPIVYEAIRAEAAAAPEPLTLIAGSLGLSARIAHETLGLPLVSVHLQPAVLRSVHEFPELPGLGALRWLPKGGKRLLYRMIDTLVVDRALGAPLNRFRATLGLPPVRRLMESWWHAPDLVLGLFPEWYAARQPDWPAQLRLVGFPLYDESDATERSWELDAFLAAGAPPIVVAPGSANVFGRSVFEPVVAACRQQGRRAVLLTRFADQVPADLPPGVLHLPYVPFSQILPYAAALVHHGGIGTTAQALAAGVPQLIRPMAHDQFDNAARVRRLGLGTSLAPKRFTADRVAASLDALLADRAVADRCRALAPRLREGDPLGLACEQIEALATRASRSDPVTGDARIDPV